MWYVHNYDIIYSAKKGIFLNTIHCIAPEVYSMSRKKCHSTVCENIPKPQNKFWMLCSDAWENLHKTHVCLGQGLGVSVQLKKFQNLFGFGIFSEIVRVTLLSGHTVQCCTSTSNFRTSFPAAVMGKMGTKLDFNHAAVLNNSLCNAYRPNTTQDSGLHLHHHYVQYTNSYNTTRK